MNFCPEEYKERFHHQLSYLSLFSAADNTIPQAESEKKREKLSLAIDFCSKKKESGHVLVISSVLRCCMTSHGKKAGKIKPMGFYNTRPSDNPVIHYSINLRDRLILLIGQGIIS